jgi:large subunit ribosomal protein L13
VEKTTRFFKTEHAQQKWHLVDAQGRKHKPMFTPNADVGDFVVVVNAAKVKVTGKRAEVKEYFHYTGYPGGATYERFKDLMQKNPQRVIEHAVRGMLPHNRLGRQIFKKLKVYAGPEHPHAAQRPESYNA